MNRARILPKKSVVQTNIANHFDILYTRLVLLNVGHTLSSNSTVQIYELLCDIVPYAYTFYILLGEICLF